MKDHRDIGREMDLFMFSELSPGCPIWLPHGNTVYNILQDKIRALQKECGYVEVRTPILWKKELYQKSGHWDHYGDNMFGVHGNDEDVLLVPKPMNCPGHMEIFGSKSWSVRDLPYRMADQGMLHRDEVSGALGGLTRCRGFCQDDAHLFVTPDQVGGEIASLIDMVQRVYTKLGMTVRAVLSTRPASFMGEGRTWDGAEDGLRSALLASRQDFTEDGGGAFYGPKIDFHLKDSHGREWQTATIQLDFQLPQRFSLGYTDHDNSRKTPVVIHRAIYGSFERFIGILLEHYQGHLPVWLAPVQYAVIPVTDRTLPYAEEIHQKLGKWKLRSEVDNSNNRTGQKIAVAQTRYVPKMLILGDREAADGTVTIRSADGKNETLPKRDFFSQAAYLNEFDF